MVYTDINIEEIQKSESICDPFRAHWVTNCLCEAKKCTIFTMMSQNTAEKSIITQ